MKGAFYTGQYRNVFQEYGYSGEEIRKKVEDTWHKLFYGDDDTRIYYPVGEDMGYILDTGNDDARTEGMSYGMMMCVQMDKKEEFDRIWKWSYTYMLHRTGKYKGYFAWSLNTDGTKRAEGPAPDGEEYFAMALLFASRRWGDGPEPFDYSRQAKEILKVCVHKGENGEEGDPMWEPSNKLIKFIPESPYTDASYHLPHYYELFSLWGNPEDHDFWREAAEASREHLRRTCHPVTGLAPGQGEFDGTPRKGKWPYAHVFYSDSYRVAANIGMDYSWFGKDEWQKGAAERIQAFFAPMGVQGDYKVYEVDGTVIEDEAMHPVGIIATNAEASLAAEGPDAKFWVDLLWNTPVRTGKRRYYDNCLYFFAVLALSGNYRIW